MMSVFDKVADTYDRWYETVEGNAIFRAEARCLHSLYENHPGRWLEIGVGTGRFACSLGIDEGIDLSPRMLKKAKGRGVEVYAANAEILPFPGSCFDGVLMALTLCFIDDPRKALEECRRILSPHGCLLVGIVPVNGPWGKEYKERAFKGHHIYSLAHFRTAEEVTKLAQRAGFTLGTACSTLFWKPQEPPSQSRIAKGIVPDAGFLGLLFEKNASGHFENENVKEPS